MLSAGARTHVGRVRSNNEDALVWRADEGLFAVVDGMGGEAAGEVAAAIAVECLGAVPNTRRTAGEALLVEAMRNARARILAESARDPARAHLGAVASAIRFEDDGRHIALAHVGDTRVYRVNRHGVTQLTHDHVAAAAAGARKAAVARDLGRADLPEPWVDTARVPVEPGELLVLCSDGLYDPVPQEELAAELLRLWEAKADGDAAAARLVGLALARGGPDNVTVVAVRVGRWRRGRGRARLGVAATLALLAGLGALALAVGVGTRPRSEGVLPEQLSRPLELSAPVLVTLPDGAATRVEAGGTLDTRGVTLVGTTWTVDLAPGTSARLRLSAVELTGALTVTLGEGARLELAGARVRAGSILVRGEGSFTCTDSLFASRDLQVAVSEVGGAGCLQAADEGAVPWPPPAPPPADPPPAPTPSPPVP